MANAMDTMEIVVQHRQGITKFAMKKIVLLNMILVKIYDTLVIDISFNRLSNECFPGPRAMPLILL
jgi:hypothetical protein